MRSTVLRAEGGSAVAPGDIRFAETARAAEREPVATDGEGDLGQGWPKGSL